MARKSKKSVSTDEAPKTVPVHILPGAVFVCREAELVSMGSVVDVQRSEDELLVIWDCRYLVSSDRWSVREVINADALLRARGIEGCAPIDSNAGAFGGEPVVTEMRASALEAVIVASAEGTPSMVIMEKRDGREIAVFPQGTPMNLARFFNFSDWFTALHGA